jgi:hypothetical protein
MIISSHITTLLNYRMAVPFRSDFLAYNNFPEVYHGEGITTLPFSWDERMVTVQGVNTAYRIKGQCGVAHVVL